MTHRRVAQPVDVIRGGLFESAANDHAEAVADASVTRGTVDIEPLTAAIEQGFVDCNREDIQIVTLIVLAFVVSDVFFHIAAGDSAFHLRTPAAPINDEIAGALGLVFRLVLHVETRTAGQQERGGEQYVTVPHRATSATSSGPRLSRNAAVRS